MLDVGKRFLLQFGSEWKPGTLGNPHRFPLQGSFKGEIGPPVRDLLGLGFCIRCITPGGLLGPDVEYPRYLKNTLETVILVVLEAPSLV